MLFGKTELYMLKFTFHLYSVANFSTTNLNISRYFIKYRCVRHTTQTTAAEILKKNIWLVRLILCIIFSCDWQRMRFSNKAVHDFITSYFLFASSFDKIETVLIISRKFTLLSLLPGLVVFMHRSHQICVSDHSF